MKIPIYAIDASNGYTYVGLDLGLEEDQKKFKFPIRLADYSIEKTKVFYKHGFLDRQLAKQIFEKNFSKPFGQRHKDVTGALEFVGSIEDDFLD